VEGGKKGYGIAQGKRVQEQRMTRKIRQKKRNTKTGGEEGGLVYRVWPKVVTLKNAFSQKNGPYMQSGPGVEEEWQEHALKKRRITNRRLKMRNEGNLWVQGLQQRGVFFHPGGKNYLKEKTKTRYLERSR